MLLDRLNAACPVQRWREKPAVRQGLGGTNGMLAC